MANYLFRYKFLFK